MSVFQKTECRTDKSDGKISEVERLLHIEVKNGTDDKTKHRQSKKNGIHLRENIYDNSRQYQCIRNRQQQLKRKRIIPNNKAVY
jgi:hypothetical protein